MHIFKLALTVLIVTSYLALTLILIPDRVGMPEGCAVVQIGVASTLPHCGTCTVNHTNGVES